VDFKNNRFLSAEKQVVTANPDINTVSLLTRKSDYRNSNMVESITKCLVKSLGIWNFYFYMFSTFSNAMTDSFGFDML
jgi:hypothetical protein